MEHFIKWEGDRKEFPRGPMYWVNFDEEGEKGKAGKTGFDMEALAVGAEGGKERREKICRIETKFPEMAVEMNGHVGVVKKEQLTAPTETDLPSTLLQVPGQQQLKEQGKAEGEETVTIQEGTLIPASRPEPISFVTASEGIDTLNEKAGDLALNGEAKCPKENGNINGPHQTATANLLDPSVPANGKTLETENAHQHHAAGDVTDPAGGGGVEEADKAHSSENHDGGVGLVEKVKEKIGVSA
jgi:hypothetical protein